MARQGRPRSICASYVHLCPTTPKRAVGTDILQVHLLVDSFLTSGSVDSHRPSIVFAPEAVSHGPAGAAWRDLPTSWRYAWGAEKEELWSETEALGGLDKAG